MLLPLIDNFVFNFPGRTMNQQLGNSDSMLTLNQCTATFGHADILFWKSDADFLSYHAAHIERNQGLQSPLQRTCVKCPFPICQKKHKWHITRKYDLSTATSSPISHHKNYLTSRLSLLNDKEKLCFPTAKSQKCPAPVEELLTC